MAEVDIHGSGVVFAEAHAAFTRSFCEFAASLPMTSWDGVDTTSDELIGADFWDVALRKVCQRLASRTRPVTELVPDTVHATQVAITPDARYEASGQRVQELRPLGRPFFKTKEEDNYLKGRLERGSRSLPADAFKSMTVRVDPESGEGGAAEACAYPSEALSLYPRKAKVTSKGKTRDQARDEARGEARDEARDQAGDQAEVRQPSVQTDEGEGGVPGQIDGNDDPDEVEEYGALEEVVPVDDVEADTAAEFAQLMMEEDSANRRRSTARFARVARVTAKRAFRLGLEACNDGSSLGDSDLDEIPEVSRRRGFPVASGDHRLITHPAQIDPRDPSSLRLFMTGGQMRIKSSWVPGLFAELKGWESRTAGKIEGMQLGGAGGFAEVRNGDFISVLPFRSCVIRAPRKPKPPEAFLGDVEGLGWVSTSSEGGSTDDGYLSSRSGGEMLMAKRRRLD
eukprot:Hpha_TRINITY_DN7303_c0_g1::TRINITY_DN7303_c0_g1_i1::g.10064::m.10064